MKGVILDQATFGEDVNWDAFMALPIQWQIHANTASHQTLERVRGAEILLSNKVVLDSHILQQCRSLKYIGVLATGTNNVDHDSAAKYGVKITNVEGYGTMSVAQHTLMLMLNLATNFPRYQTQVKRGDWQNAEMFCLHQNRIMELAGKHLVLVGLGELGQHVAKLAEAFGMKVTAASRPGTQATEKRPALDDVLPLADFLSLHCLLSSDTDKLINKRRLAQMKPGAFLINTARGPLVDEQALVEALASNQIAGAAVDVLSVEPPTPDNPLLNYQGDNLIVTPHNAWASAEAKQRLLDIAASQLAAFVRSSQ